MREQRPEDRPDIVARVFKLKLKELPNELTKKKQFGVVIAGTWKLSSNTGFIIYEYYCIRLIIFFLLLPLQIYNRISEKETITCTYTLSIGGKLQTHEPS